MSVHAAEPATVSFVLDFPNSNPSHYVIVVHFDGSAHYESSAKVSPDSDEIDNYKADFHVTDSASSRIFELAAQAHYFSEKVDSRGKKLAFTGSKKLTYKDDQRNSAVEFVYSSVPAVQQLTALFQNMGATLEYGHRLSYFHHYQKLALDDELKRMGDQVQRKEITELQAVKPVLQEIYDDPSVINVVRARARRLMEMAAPAVAK
jgi:hypothetical protein